jgi:hypothetical protein
MIQNRKPRTVASSSVVIFSVFIGAGGINVKIKIVKKIGVIINGIQAIPQVIGPNGVIHNWPAQVAKKRIRKKIHKPLAGLFEKTENRRAIMSVTTKAAGII